MSATVVVATGVANLASVVAALERCGERPRVVTDAAAVRVADRVVLPGNGTFGAAMAALEASGIADALRERVVRDRPLLAICLGFQLLFDASDESPGVSGLALLRGRVAPFADGVAKLGWDRVEPAGSSAELAAGYAWFAHSYRVAPDAALPLALVTDEPPYVAALARGTLLACQFHPELSGRFGRALIAGWLAGAAA